MAVRIVVRPRTRRAAAGAAGPSPEPVTYALEQTRIVIGRGAGADVRLPSAAVSETHVVLRATGSTWVAVDEGSTNGTRVDGQRLAPGRPKALRSGDVLRLPGFDLEVHLHVAAAVPTSAEATAALARRLVREVLADAGKETDPPRLVVVGGADAGRELRLPPPPARLLIGRGEHCDLVLRDADVSREHVEIACEFDGILVRDLGSKNGLIVGGRPVRERRLRDRDELVVGSTPVVFEDPAEQALRALERVPDESVPDVRADAAVGEGFAEPTGAVPVRATPPDDAPLVPGSAPAGSRRGPGTQAEAGSGPEAGPVVHVRGGAAAPAALPRSDADTWGLPGKSSRFKSYAASPHGTEASAAALSGREEADPAARPPVRRDDRQRAGGGMRGGSTATGGGVDLLVYALAVTVLAASGVALYWLLRSG
jgi:pSer/pThr/pTyr-binding forkhead associated (FHA) protein